MKLSAQRLLVIGTVWPEPKSSAAGLHLLSLIDTLHRAGAECHFASPASPYSDEHSAQHTIDLAALSITAHTIELNASSFDDFVSALAPDIVLFDRFMIEEQFSWRVRKACPNALCVLDTEDIHSLRHIRQQLTNQDPSLSLDIRALQCYHLGQQLPDGSSPPPHLLGCLHNDLALREIASIMRMDLSLIISRVELEYLTANYPIAEQRLHYCPFLISPLSDEQITQWPAYEQRQDFVFIGNYRHAPNWDAVQILAKHIWPLIKTALPHAKCHVYGAYTPAKAQQFHQPKHGFYIQGWAQDAQQVLQEARVNLAPVRFGAGLKGKLFDAMQVGTPSVTSPIGAEGIENMNPQTIGALSEEFAQVAIALFSSQTQWQVAQNDIQPLLAGDFDRQTHQYALVNRISDALMNRERDRATDFWQHLLNRQSLKATQYMSQWIEAKQTIAQLQQSNHQPEIDSDDD